MRKTCPKDGGNYSMDCCNFERIRHMKFNQTGENYFEDAQFVYQSQWMKKQETEGKIGGHFMRLGQRKKNKI